MRLSKALFFGSALLLIAFCIAINIGPSDANIFDLFTSEENTKIALSLRLPRVLLGAIVGMALAASGAAYQGLLQNPLADPYLLGVSGGAALGTAIAVGLGLPTAIVPLVAFLFSLTAMFIVLCSKVQNKESEHCF